MNRLLGKVTNTLKNEGIENLNRKAFNYIKNKRIENETFPSFFELIIIYFVSH